MLGRSRRRVRVVDSARIDRRSRCPVALGRHASCPAGWSVLGCGLGDVGSPPSAACGHRRDRLPSLLRPPGLGRIRSGVRRWAFIYPIFGASDSLIEPLASDGRYRAKVLWVSNSSYQGPVLIRGAQVDGRGWLELSTDDSASTTELRLLRASTTSPGEEAGWREWPSYTDVPGSRCYAYREDGGDLRSPIQPGRSSPHRPLSV